MFLDGGRQAGPRQRRWTPWPSRSKQFFTIVYDEASWEQGRERLRGFVQLPEGVHFLTRQPHGPGEAPTAALPGQQHGWGHRPGATAAVEGPSAPRPAVEAEAVHGAVPAFERWKSPAGPRSQSLRSPGSKPPYLARMLPLGGTPRCSNGLTVEV